MEQNKKKSKNILAKKGLEFKKLIKRLITKKKFKINSLILIFVVILVVLVFVFNFVVSLLVDRYDLKIDLTSKRLYKISNETKNFLKDYNQEVDLILLNSEDYFKKNSDVYSSHLYNISKNFAACSSYINLQFVNLDEKPNFVANFKDLQLQQNGILIKRKKDGVAKFISIDQMFERKAPIEQNEKDFGVVSNVEQKIANKLEFLSGRKMVKALNIKGHKEFELNKSNFEENGFLIEDFNFSSNSQPKEDFSFILVVAPVEDFKTQEIEFLKDQLKKGKQLVYFASAIQPKLPNLDEFLSFYFGVSFKEGVLVQTDASKMGNRYPNNIFISIKQNKFLKDVYNKNAPLGLDDSRPMELNTKNKNLNFFSICETEKTTTILNEKEEEKTKKEEKSFNIAVAVENKEKDVLKAIVFSGASILPGMEISQFCNGEFVLSILGSISNNSSRIKILPKTIGLSRIFMTKKQGDVFGFVFVLIVPLFTGLFGFLIYFKRKRRWKSLKNLKKSILVIFLILLFFLGLLVFLKFSFKKEKKLETFFEVSNLTKIEVLKKGEPAFSVLKNYLVSDLEKVPINKELVDELFNFMSKIKADYVFNTNENLKEFGLLNPAFKFKLKGNDSKEWVLNVGEKNHSKTGYYVNLKAENEKENKIAILNTNKIEPFLITKLGYVKLNLVEPYEKTFGEDGLYNQDGVRRCLIKRKDLKDSLEFETDEKGNIFVKSPKNFKFSNSEIVEIEKGPNLLVAKDVFLVKPSQQDLEKCGFLNPTAVVEYLIDSKKYCIKIGGVFKVEAVENSAKEEKEVKTLKYYYVLVEGMDVIYILSENLLPWIKIGLKN